MSKAINRDALQTALGTLGLTQKDLAASIGVSSQAVTNWLKGKDFLNEGKGLIVFTLLNQLDVPVTVEP